MPRTAIAAVSDGGGGGGLSCNFVHKVCHQVGEGESVSQNFPKILAGSISATRYVVFTEFREHLRLPVC